jgi:hypothetical protein
MKRLTRLGITAMAIVIASSALADTARAQCTANGSGDSCNVPGTASMTAGRVVRLQMTAGSTSLSAPTPTDFDAGFNATTGPTMTISANAPWALLVRSAAAFWTGGNTDPSAPARTTKPAGDLNWSTASNGTFNALTTGDVTLVGGVATASSATTLYFQTLYNWSLDTPGNYSLSVVLTLTSP